MENFLARNFKVSSYDLDPLGRARLTTLAGFFQEMAYLHAGKLGFGFRDLEQRHSFWVLSRMKVRVHRYPLWDEEVRVETWHNGIERLFGLREFRVMDREDQPAAIATSAWLILDSGTRRPVKPDENLLGAGTGRGFLFAEKLEKIEVPADAVPLATRKVVHSDLDLLGHVNNVKYMEWCIDLCVEQQETGGMDPGIGELEINFRGEVRLGERVEILGSWEPAGEDSDGSGNSIIEGSGGSQRMVFLARETTTGREVFRARLKCGNGNRR